MTALAMFSAPVQSLRSLQSTSSSQRTWLALGLATLMLVAFSAIAATNTGTSLQGAFNLVNDIVNGYGKQLMFVLGFAVAMVGFMVQNTTGTIMKFIGFAIFLGTALSSGLGLVGALV
jgi:hypothetical protein